VRGFPTRHPRENLDLVDRLGLVIVHEAEVDPQLAVHGGHGLDARAGHPTVDPAAAALALSRQRRSIAPWRSEVVLTLRAGPRTFTVSCGRSCAATLVIVTMLPAFCARGVMTPPDNVEARER
jgi:hypothetical protein